ncbi:ferric iron reductase protein FhuF [Planotetraspora sp. GP83]
MTAYPGRVPLLDPLVTTLESLAAERGGVLGVLPRLVTEDSPEWTRAPELVCEPYGPLLSLVDETAARWGAPRHVAAALLWKTYSYWHTLPMALGWALGRRVPLMRFADTVVRSSDAGVTVAAVKVTVAVLPDDPLAGAPGTKVADHLGTAIKDALLDGQEPVITALGALTKVGARTLWGSTAEAFVHPLMRSGTYGQAAALLKEIGEPVDGLVVPHETGYRRRTCCLWITLPDAAPCSTCCVV